MKIWQNCPPNLQHVYCHSDSTYMHHLGAKSFTSLKADLCQGVNGGLRFAGALLEHFLEGSTPLRRW